MTNQTRPNETQVLQALWRKAYRNGEVTLELPSESDAKRMRFALYNAVRAVRQGKAIDAELTQAAEDCSIRIEGKRITIQTKTKTEAMQAALAALGSDAGELLSATPLEAPDAEVAQSMRRLQELLEQPPEDKPAPRVTPYYTMER